MKEKTIVFFDRDCLLCQGSLRWLHRLDAQDRLSFAPLQGKTAEKYGVSLTDDSMAVHHRGEISRRSEAVRIALAETGVPGFLASLPLKVIPVRLRDIVYREIAKRRKNLVKTACEMPEQGMVEKLLD